jgi:hypothetical protein
VKGEFIMKRALILSAFVSILILFAGCIITDDSLDYRNDLSDHEVKKIVRTVLLSQNSINRAGLITSDGLENLVRRNSRYYNDNRLECSDGGYLTFTLFDDNFAITLETETPLHIDYYECLYAPLYYDASRLDGGMNIIYHQHTEDSYEKLLDFSIEYLDTYLYSSGTTIRIDGKLGVHYDEDYLRHQLALVFSANRLEIENRTYYDKDIFTNIVLEYHIDTNTYAYRYSYSGTLYNSYFGRLTFSTLTPMEGYGNHNPRIGRFKISNAHINLLVIPQDDYYVDIIVENHYYPSRNHTIHTTWLNIGL